MDNFYKLYYATPDKNETGYVSHQVEVSSKQENYDFTLSNSYQKTYFEKKIDYEVVFPIFKLVKGAKLTDLMNYSGGGSYSCIIISSKLLSIIKNFRIDDYQTFNIKIRNFKHIQDYFFFMYAPERESEFVNWEETTFRIKPYVKEYESDQTIKFEDKQDYIKLRMELFNKPKQDQEVELTNLKLKSELIDKDMFRFGGISLNFFESKVLKEEIQKQGITSIRFAEADGLRKPYRHPKEV